MGIGAGEQVAGGWPELFTSQCACKDCQKATGTGHTTIVGLRRDQLALQDEPKTYTKDGDTGGKVTRHFCGNCGGRLFTTGDLPGDEMAILQAGSLDDPEVISPESVIYVKDAPSWDFFDPDLPQYEAMQPRER
ncbi:MAG: GFA family protein [Alteraurantiacibacter sp.]